MKIKTAAAMASALALAGCANTGHPSGAPMVVGGSAPVLEAITQREIIEDGYPTVIPEFHFHDRDGDVRFLEREIVTTNGPYARTKGVAITFPADLQQRGAVFAGRWNCGPNTYYAKIHAYLIDRAGNHSNAMDYTIHCNGG